MCLQHIHGRRVTSPSLKADEVSETTALLMRPLLSLLNILFMLKMFYDHLKSNQSVNSPDLRKHSWEKGFLLSSFFSLIPSLWEF